MTKRVKLTIAAANVILRSIRWRSHSTEYQVMVKRAYTHPDTGEIVTTYRYGAPQGNYRDALLEIERISDADRANAVIFRIKTERPA